MPIGLLPLFTALAFHHKPLMFTTTFWVAFVTEFLVKKVSVNNCKARQASTRTRAPLNGKLASLRHNLSDSIMTE